MTWSTSRNADEFLARAGDFLGTRPVEHSVLLTDAAYLSARPDPATDQHYGWWSADGGEVGGAFLQAPRHAPVLSGLPADGLESIMDVLPNVTQINLDARLADSLIATWRRRTGTGLAERSRIRLYQLGTLASPPPVRGRPRVATLADRGLLVSWYEQLMAAHPDDPSDLAYVVEDPIAYGGIVLWEVDGVPVAMAGRSRVVAGMTRLGAVYAPNGGGYDDAVFFAACRAAQNLARTVLVLAGAGDYTRAAAYQRLGFRPVLDRVTLGPRSAT